MINPRRMLRRVTVLGLCVCLSIWVISAIPHSKKPRNGHHKNQHPMGKILKKAF